MIIPNNATRQSGRRLEKVGNVYISEERCEAELARNSEWRQERERARKRAWRQTGMEGKSRDGDEKIISFFHNFCWKFRSAAWKIHTEVRGRR